MSQDKYLPIIGYGERMIEPIKKSFGGGEKKYPRSYDEARVKIKQQIKELKTEITKIPKEKRMDEIVVTVRLNEKFLAKSHVPNTFFRNAHFENVGSRKWCMLDEDGEEKYSKMHFVKFNDGNLKILEDVLDIPESQLTESFKDDLRKVEEISFLSKDEIIQGFDNDWQEGRVEFVLHPFENENELMVNKFKDMLLQLGVSEETVKIKVYNSGPVFVSAMANKRIIGNISDFNPLRTVHPLTVNLFPGIRSYQNEIISVSPPKANTISTIKVGVFDGGIDENHPFLKGFVKEGRSVSSTAMPEGIQHGTAVAGVVLYGDLNQYEENSKLEDPVVSVESFRVLPQSNPLDFDLYEAIDLIEEVVPAKHEIDVYNLSFGPSGPIFDDEITRFTYSLDQLAWDFRKLFIVAVGNDGDQSAPYNRIQAPADLVNGLGVGAFSFDYSTGKKVRASYSCVGDGREGCKVKPDVCAFGGDSHFPIHLLSTNYDAKSLSAGTSFASPIIAGKAAELLGRCNQFDSLTARAILVHSATNPDKVDNQIGYGIVDQSVDEILKCDENRVTVVYSSSLNPSSMAKLPIPLPRNAELSGSVELSWTIVTLSKANALHVEDYTESAIEDTFYPHDKKYKFTKNKQTKTMHINNDEREIAGLLQEGWSRSSLPLSSGTESYQTEQARRGELKWDTVVKRWKRMRPSSLENPFLVLHGLGRNGSTDRMDYAVVVTISVPKYEGNLHEDILHEYQVLDTVHLRNRQDIMVPIR